MAISSVSRTYDAPDPILENDLELLAKVNTFQQAKFDQGEQELQNEVDKWSLMANIAKPELRAYANQKLNNLVQGIQGLGGVNLSDPNNVNSLKSLGYNIYGDQRITNGVITTKKMQALATDAQTKLSGKDADKYDATLSSYLMNGYNEWASDGNLDSKYDGPSMLPQGNMNTINKKVTDYLKELKPDAENFPQGVDPKSLGYFQMGDKWLRKERIAEAVNMQTDENDQLIFRAHGWKGMSGYDDPTLIELQKRSYAAAANEIKSNIERFKIELSQTKDTNQKLYWNQQIADNENALKDNDKELSNFSSKTQLSKPEREYIQQAIYSKAWKDNVANSYAYNQKTTELKLNAPVAFQVKEERLGKQWAADYNLNVKKFAWDMEKDKADFALRERELDAKNSGTGKNPFGLTGPASFQKANTQGENEMPTPAPFIEKFKTDYYDTHMQYYQKLYNKLGEQDPTKFDYNPTTKMYTPKPMFAEEVNKEVTLFDNKLSDYPNLTDEEKKTMHMPVDQGELNELLALKKKNSLVSAYYEMARGKENEIFNYAKTNNLISEDWRDSKINMGPELGGVKTIEQALAEYEKLTPEGKKKWDATELRSPVKETKGFFGGQEDNRPSSISKNRGTTMDLFNRLDPTYTFSDLKEELVEIKEDLNKAYQKAGGKIYNSYETVIPFKSVKPEVQDAFKKELLLNPQIGKTDVDQINPISGSVDLDGATGETRFKMKVQVGSGKKLDTKTIDVTDQVRNGKNSLMASLYPQNDMSLIFGMYLSNSGSTPFNASDGFKNSLKTTYGNYPYQIIRGGENGGTEYFKVKMMYPIGGGKTMPIDVKNIYDNGSYKFPATVEGVDEYMDRLFSTPEGVKLFKKEHNIKDN